MWFALYAVISAQAAPDPAALAPTPRDLHQHLDTLDRELLVASALEETVARLQNGWVETGAADRSSCADPDAASLAARMVAFGASWRDAAQRALGARDRVAQLWDGPTLTPLITDADRQRFDQALTAVEAAQATYLEAAAWHQRYAEPYVLRCAPALTEASGLPRREHRPAEERPRATAIATLQPGFLCAGADAVPVSGVAVVEGERACYSTAPCACTPVPVSPGAVLGPAGTNGGP
ncbi:MAG: hypothetical protein JXX28_04165 [Deltaproteobacteria bacterium]|nr:hypothetical protein [Deltaproteobacteria bacterium]